MHQQALLLYEKAGDRRGMGGQYRSLAVLWQQRGDLEQARVFYELALSLHRELDWQCGVALAEDGLGQVAEREGDLERALAWYTKALERFRHGGYKQSIVDVNRRLGSVCLRLDEHADAVMHYEEALDLCEEMDDRQGVGRCCKQLGDLYLSLAVDDPDRASVMLERALTTYRALNDERGEGAVYTSLGNLAARRGEITQAIAMWTAASARYRKLGVDDRVMEIDTAIKRLWGHNSSRVA